jgi:uncharacterized Ntn-hydrolase superfamily protein
LHRFAQENKSCRISSRLAAGFRDATCHLVARMPAAQVAGRQAGGDLHGGWYAAILVVSGEAAGRALPERLVDRYIEVEPGPLVALRRLPVRLNACGLLNCGNHAGP